MSGWEEREIYYKELAHMILEAEKSQDLQLVSRSPRRPNGISFSLKVSNLKTQEEMIRASLVTQW